jgi:ABC-type spermidine/putrescine transport system permease subunit I
MTAAVRSQGTPGLARRLRATTASRYDVVTTALLLAPMLVVLLAVFYLPLVQFLSRSFLEPAPTLDNYVHIAETPLYGTILLRTFRTGLVVAVGTLVLGYPIAYLMSTLRGWRLILVAAIVILPLWVSVLVRTYAWQVILGRNGAINQILVGLGIVDAPIRLLNTEFAVWLAMTHILLPFMVLPIYSSLRGIPRDLPRSAQSLGASWPAVIRHIILPLSLPGVAAGMVLVFVISLGYFITPMLLGGPTTMMIASLISQQATKLLDWPMASAIAAVLLLTTIVILALFHRVLRLDRVMGNG